MSVKGNDASDPPKCRVPRTWETGAPFTSLVCTLGTVTLYAVTVPYTIPTAQPASRAHRWNQRVKSPATIATKVCRIHTPPSSCILMAFCLSRARTNSSAPNLTTSDVIFEVRASSWGVASGLMYSL